MLRAATYSRQSADKTKSIEDQAKENRATADGQGWPVVAEYADGTSASRFAKKRRDEWDRVLADIASRAWDVLILWESSRGDRTPESWLAMLSRCREQRIAIHVTNHARTYDMTNPRDWRTLAEDGIDNAYESEKISQRVRRGLASSAVAGRPAMGRAPHGYRRVYDDRTGKLVGQEVDPVAAPVVREVFDRVVRGEPISAIVRDLNARGVPTQRAQRWYPSRVREMIATIAYISVREHGGERYPGTWPSLVDEATWYAAQRVLAPRRNPVRPGRQVHLLSYLATCGVCGTPLSVQTGRYRCDERGCVMVAKAPVDELVEHAILKRVSSPDFYRSLRRDGAEADRDVMAARTEAAQLRARLDEWRTSAAAGQTSPASLAAIEGELSGQIRAADRRAERAGIPPALRQLLEPGAAVRVRWEAMPVPARRDAIRALAVIVVRRSAVPGGRGVFDPQRLAGSRWVGDELTWGDHWAA